ncbi:VanZ family protein [Listeria sp. FSL L7-0229]|uniref:VanZ family protein n=1 Tax=Listeria cossartiae TaxID=2838249 RepID=UPI001628710D|nr:VanZ family protein [Listeria cossartiae]MBC2191702.1 VanZ family protein [Listeria cossartiae subsp. cossartiae]
MLRFSGLVMTIALLVYIVFFLLRWLKRREKLEMIIFKTCLYVYICGVIKFTIFPLMLDAVLIEDTKLFVTGSYINLVPFNSIKEIFMTGREHAAFQIVANFILFVPLGILLPLCYPKMTWKSVFAISLLATVGIESAQLIQDLIYQAPFKFVDIDDVILNFSGGVAGFLIFILCRPLLKKLGLYD